MKSRRVIKDGYVLFSDEELAAKDNQEELNEKLLYTLSPWFVKTLDYEVDALIKTHQWVPEAGTVVEFQELKEGEEHGLYYLSSACADCIIITRDDTWKEVGCLIERPKNPGLLAFTGGFIDREDVVKAEEKARSSKTSVELEAVAAEALEITARREASEEICLDVESILSAQSKKENQILHFAGVYPVIKDPRCRVGPKEKAGYPERVLSVPISGLFVLYDNDGLVWRDRHLLVGKEDEVEKIVFHPLDEEGMDKLKHGMYASHYEMLERALGYLRGKKIR